MADLVQVKPPLSQLLSANATKLFHRVRSRHPSRAYLLAEIGRRGESERLLTQRQEFLTAVIESMSIGVIAVDNDGDPVVWNAAARSTQSLATEQPEDGLSAWAETFHALGPDGSQMGHDSNALGRALAGERIAGEETEVQIAGVSRLLSIYASPIILSDGTPAGAICTAADISALHMRETELARANDDLDAIARATAQVLNGDDARQAVVDAALSVSGGVSAMLFEPPHPAASTLVAVAQAGIRVEGLALATNAVSRTVDAFRSGRVQYVTDIDNDAKVAHAVRDAITSAMGDAPSLRSAIAVPVLRDGVPLAVLSVVLNVPVSTSNLRLLGLLELLSSNAALAISREDSARELARLASTDSLTGLANRRSWDNRIEEEVERARRTDLPLTVVILDLDNFKGFNDSRGHQAGDALLAAGALAWAGVLRSGDMLARLGGEEFGVLLPGCAVGNIPGLVERLIHALPEGQTCSAGVAEWAGEAAGHTVARADAALYEAKRAGRATFRIAYSEAGGDLSSPRPASAA